MILAHKLASGTDPVGQNLSQPEPNPIRDDFAQYDPGRLWKNATESESGKVEEGRLRSVGNRARWFLHID